MRDLEVPVERGAGRALHAMVRPQDLRAVGSRDGVVGLLAGMAEAKDRWPARVPVLGQHDMAEARGQAR